MHILKIVFRSVLSHEHNSDGLWNSGHKFPYNAAATGSLWSTGFGHGPLPVLRLPWTHGLHASTEVVAKSDREAKDPRDEYSSADCCQHGTG